MIKVKYNHKFISAYRCTYIKYGLVRYYIEVFKWDYYFCHW